MGSRSNDGIIKYLFSVMAEVTLCSMSLRTQAWPAIEFVSGKEGLRPFLLHLLGLPELRKHPWSLRGSRGYAPMGADGWDCSLLYAVYQMLSLFFPCTVTVNGAAGHNRGEVAETPPLARTQGRTVDCSFNVYRVCVSSHTWT